MKQALAKMAGWWRLGCLALLLLPVSGRAVTLDWSSASISWTAGALSASFDIDSSNPGNDITITISGVPSSVTNLFQNGYPAISSTYTPATTLTLYLNSLTSETQKVVVSVAFNYAAGVSNVTTTLYDVDQGTSSGKGTYGFDDQIQALHGTNTSGGLVAATVTTSPDNTVTGNGTTNVTVWGTATAGATSTNGNVGVSFGTNVITGYTFTWDNNTTNTISDPDQQAIGLGNITYTPVARKLPECGTFLALAATGFSCGLMRWRARKK